MGNAAKMNALVGAVIDDRYEVGAPLGSGAMGQVFRGRQRALDRPVAIKVVSERHAKDAELVSRFKREAKAASAIGHPGIAQVFDFGRLPDGRAYLIMELIEGRSLGAILKEGGPLSVERAVGIAKQACDILTAAHDHHIVHRDMKPDNLLLMDGDRVKLIDFGIAKLLDVSLVLTKTNTMVGTPLYMAPEQWQGDTVDGRTDLYALGGMIFEMIAGRPPFETDHLHTIITKHLTETPPTLQSLVPGVPTALSELVARCLAKRLDDRPHSAQALAEELERGLGPSLGFAPTQSTPQPMPQFEAGPTPTPPSSPMETPPPQAAVAPLPGPMARTELYEGRRVARPKSKLPWILAGAFALLLVSGAMVYGALSLVSGTRDAATTTTTASGPAPVLAPPTEPAVLPTPDPIEPAAPVVAEEESGQSLADDAPTTLTMGGMSATPRAGTPENEPAPPPEVARVAFLLESEPSGARVHADGFVVGRTPYELDVTHPRRVTISADGYEPRTVELRPGEPGLRVTLRRAEPVRVGSMRAPPPPAMAEPPPNHSSRTRGWDD